MTNPLRVMDPQVSLREYLREANLPNPGPSVLIDEDDAVRRIAKELGQDLPPEACYLEQLWVRVDPAGIVDEGGGGTTPAWVPADARIHIDFLGGDPQGRAWVDGTGEATIDALLGDDPNAAAWAVTSYDPGYITSDGYVDPGGSVGGGTPPAFIGAARDLVLGASGFTIRTVHKNIVALGDTGFDAAFLMLSVDGNDALEVDFIGELADLRGSSWAGSLGVVSNDSMNTATNALNCMAVTIAGSRYEQAANGSAVAVGTVDSTDRPPGNLLVAALIDAGGQAIQSITIYDPLPTTAGLSELSAIT